MSQVLSVFRREFQGYFRSPVAYVVLTAFVVLAMIFWIFVSRFFRSNTASLEMFFFWMPWLFCLFAPATSMRLWAEERRAGTIELLLTLPLTTTQAVVGKFLAAWAFVATGVLLTLSSVFTVSYLGDPDWGVMIISYVGTILMAAAFLGICAFTSALTRNQVIAFILGVFVCLMLTFLGHNVLSGFLGAINMPVWLVDAIANFSFVTHFEEITRGLFDLQSVVFFLSVTAVSLVANVIVLER